MKESAQLKNPDREEQGIVKKVWGRDNRETMSGAQKNFGKPSPGA